MNSRSLFIRAPFAAAVALVAAVALHADENTDTIKFSHPEKPGTFKIALARGSIRIHGSDAPEVTVKSEAQPKHHKRQDGLRVLTESASYSLAEKDNVITLDGGADGWMGEAADFDITVPKATNVVIGNSLGGDIVCTGIAGDLEIKSLEGQVKLTDITGGAVVDTMNGEIYATVRELHDGKPLSFTSMNGAVVLRVPDAAKANVRLRTQNGTILTDFDEKALVTKVENLGGIRHRHGEMLTPEMHKAIREVTRASVAAAKEIAEAAREAARAANDAANASNDDDDGDGNKPPRNGIVAPVPPVPPIPTIPTIPSMSGGKVVSGALNGGGPEISVATMNGDVTLRRLEN